MSPVYINGVEQGAAGYTDAQALAAAVQAGAITDGETKAPTHDAVYDVKVTADAALPASQKAAASGVASLDASSLVVQDPVNAVSTATANKIVKRDASARAAFAAPAAAGDALIKGTAQTTDELPALTTGKIWEGVANRPSEVAMPAPGIWTLLETLSPAAVASIDSSVLTAYDLFMVQFSLACGAASRLQMRLNSDTGTKYDSRQIVAANTIGTTANASYLTIIYVAAACKVIGNLFLAGTLGAVDVPISFTVAPEVVNAVTILYGNYTAAANITKFTFSVDAGNTITGKITIYGMNFA